QCLGGRAPGREDRDVDPVALGGDVGRLGVLDDEVETRVGDGLAGAACGGEDADGAVRHRARLQQAQQHAAHLAGRAGPGDDRPVGPVAGGGGEVGCLAGGGAGRGRIRSGTGAGHGRIVRDACSSDAVVGAHRPVPPYTTASVCSASRPNAEWIARTASSRRASSVTTEMRISEVEIMSMLMPPSPSAWNRVAETPGEDFMPAPTRETLPMSGL